MPIKNIVLPNISAAAFLIADKFKKEGAANTLFVCRDEQEMEDFIFALQTFAPERDFALPLIGEDKYSISAGLYDIYSSAKPIAAAALYSACAKELPGRKDFANGIINLNIAQTITRGDLLFKLEKYGYDLDSGDFYEDEECDELEGEVDEDCTSDCRRVDLFDAVKDLLCAGDTNAAIRLLDLYLLDEDRDDRMARRMRDSFASVASAGEHTSMDVYTNRRYRDAYDDEVADESRPEPNMMAYRVIIKMVSGRCLAKDFDSMESARDWLVQNSLFGMRRNMDGTLGCLLDDDFHYFDINPENIDYITAGPKPRFDEFLEELSEITD